MNIFDALQEINQKPATPFEPYTAAALWTDPHIGRRMLQLNVDLDLGIRFGLGSKQTAIHWMVSHFSIGAGTKILVLGSGSGVYAEAFAQAGAHVTGVDFSPFAIDYARQRARENRLTIDYVQEDYLTYQTKETFSLIFFFGRNLSALSFTQRKKLLSKIHEWLAPGGQLFVDVYTPFRFHQVIEKRSAEYHPDYTPLDLPDPFSYQPRNGAYTYSAGEGFWSSDPYYLFLDTFKYEVEGIKVFVEKYSLFEPSRHRVFACWIACYDLHQVREFLAPHQLEVTEWYANKEGRAYDLEAGALAVVAKKRQ